MNKDLIITIIQIIQIILSFIFMLGAFQLGKNEGGRVGIEIGIVLGRKAEVEGWDKVTIDKFKFIAEDKKKKK